MEDEVHWHFDMAKAASSEDEVFDYFIEPKAVSYNQEMSSNADVVGCCNMTNDTSYNFPASSGDELAASSKENERYLLSRSNMSESNRSTSSLSLDENWMDKIVRKFKLLKVKSVSSPSLEFVGRYGMPEDNPYNSTICCDHEVTCIVDKNASPVQFTTLPPHLLHKPVPLACQPTSHCSSLIFENIVQENKQYVDTHSCITTLSLDDEVIDHYKMSKFKSLSSLDDFMDSCGISEDSHDESLDIEVSRIMDGIASPVQFTSSPPEVLHHPILITPESIHLASLLQTDNWNTPPPSSCHNFKKGTQENEPYVYSHFRTSEANKCTSASYSDKKTGSPYKIPTVKSMNNKNTKIVERCGISEALHNIFVKFYNDRIAEIMNTTSSPMQFSMLPPEGVHRPVPEAPKPHAPFPGKVPWESSRPRSSLNCEKMIQENDQYVVDRCKICNAVHYISSKSYDVEDKDLVGAASSPIQPSSSSPREMQCPAMITPKSTEPLPPKAFDFDENMIEENDQYVVDRCRICNAVHYISSKSYDVEDKDLVGASSSPIQPSSSSPREMQCPAMITPKSTEPLPPKAFDFENMIETMIKSNFNRKSVGSDLDDAASHLEQVLMDKMNQLAPLYGRKNAEKKHKTSSATGKKHETSTAKKSREMSSSHDKKTFKDKN